MADGKVVIDSTIDDEGVTKGIAKIKSALRGLDERLADTAKLGAAITIAPAAVPAVASLTAGVGALSSALSAAGIGMAGFGAVAVATLNDVFEANENIVKAQEKLAEAKTWKERQKAMEEMEQATAGLNHQQLKALESLQAFKKFWGQFVTDFDSSVVKAFGTSLDVLKQILELSAPAIHGAAYAVNNLLDSLNQSLKTDQVKDIFEYFGNDAQMAIEGLGRSAGNMLLGVMNIMKAFSPTSNSLVGTIENLSKSFADWTATLEQSDAFQKFIEYSTRNGPKVMAFLGELGGLIIDLGKAFAPFGEWLLGAMTNVIKFMRKLIELDPIIGVLLVAFTQISGAVMFLGPILIHIGTVIGNLIGWFAGLFKKVDGSMKIMTMLRTAFTAIISPIGLVVSAIVGLIAIFTAMWRTNEQFRESVMTIWNAIKTTISTAISFVRQYIMQIWTQIKTFWDENQASILAAVQNVWTVIQFVINTALKAIMAIFKFIWPVIKLIVIGTWNAIKNVINGAINVILGVIKFFASLFTGNWKGMWDAVKQILSGAVELIWGLIQIGFIGKIFKVIKLFGGKVVQAFKWLGSKAKGIFEDLLLRAMYLFDKIKAAIMKPVNAAKNKVIDFFEDMYLKVLYKVDDLKSAASKKFNKIKDFMMKPIKGAADFIKKQLDKIKGFFSGLKLKLPKIKLPHFSIKGGLDLNPMGGMSVPKLSVDWYKDGGVFPANSPRLVGIGDASVPEAALPLKPSVLGMIGQKIADQMPEQENTQKPKQPLLVNLRLGSTDFKGFVDDITEVQEREIDIAERFGG